MPFLSLLAKAAGSFVKKQALSLGSRLLSRRQEQQAEEGSQQQGGGFHEFGSLAFSFFGKQLMFSFVVFILGAALVVVVGIVIFVIFMQVTRGSTLPVPQL